MKFLIRMILAAPLWAGVNGFAADAAKPMVFKVSVQSFTAPAKWKSTPTASRMRAAQFTVPGKAKADAAECVFFYFGPGQAGGVQEGGKMCDHRLGYGGRTGKEKGLDAEEGDSQMPHEEEDPEGAQGWQDRLQQFQQTVFRHRVPRFSGG